jgi:hypothetical protein
MTGSDVTGSDMTGSDVSHATGSDHARKYVLRMCNRKLRHIRLSGAFWPEVTSVTWPEVALIWSRFCACPAFSRVFFLVVVTWLPDITEGHLTTLGVPLIVRLRNTRSDRRSRDPFGSIFGVFSMTSASYNPRKPRVLYLVWLLELALVICPFYFHIVSI